MLVPQVKEGVALPTFKGLQELWLYNTQSRSCDFNTSVSHMHSVQGFGVLLLGCDCTLCLERGHGLEVAPGGQVLDSNTASTLSKRSQQGSPPI